MPLTYSDGEPRDYEEAEENYFQQIKNKAAKIGFADGVADGRDSVFQKGFDLGYKDGFRTSFEIEKFRNFFKNINKSKLEPDNCLLREKEEFDKMNLKESTSPDHFQYTKHKDESLTSISQKQNQYIDHVIDECEHTLPNSAALLKCQAKSTNSV
ncbi:uncharacterized protein LOC101901182 [Musca domestica]|uniref:Uncharacterized protein LOC101901182 n=1 Tax=Musca domestica TaxID=7370 RepID=A0A1I8M328_MUSDO|nr:uncharacterized protein LOC101901182 [Musca domestica]